MLKGLRVDIFSQHHLLWNVLTISYIIIISAKEKLGAEMTHIGPGGRECALFAYYIL